MQTTFIKVDLFYDFVFNFVFFISILISFDIFIKRKLVKIRY